MIHEFAEVYPAVIIIAAAVTVTHMFIMIHVILLSWIAKPEAEVSDRVIGFCTFQTFHCLSQTVFLDAVVEASAVEFVGRNTENVGQTISCIHYG